MQFFANRLKFDEFGYPVRRGTPGYHDAEQPRWHYDTLPWAFTTIFQVLSGENWNSVMYDGWRAIGPGAVFFYFTLVTFGMFIVMNLFMAILLSNFSDGAFDTSSDNESEVANEGEDADGATPEDDAHSDGLSHSMRIALEDGDLNDDDAANVSDRESIFPLDPNPTELFLGPDSWLRVGVARLIDHALFESFIMLLIIVSSLLLALDSPLLDPEGDLAQGLAQTNLVFTILFVSEMVLKIVAIGFVKHPGSYLRYGWNVLDMFVVFISLAALILGDARELHALRSLRGMRALRPLRMVKRLPGLRTIVDALLAAIPAAGNVMAVCALFFLIFAIICVNYFKGDLRQCAGDVFDELISPNASYFAQIVNPKAWDDLTAQERSWFGTQSPIWLSSSSGGDGFSDAISGCESGLIRDRDSVNASAMASMWHAANVPCCDAWPSARSHIPPTGRDVCECWGGSWEPVVPQSFDDTRWAMLSLFEIATTEGWVDVMYAAVDARGIGAQPIRDTQSAWVWFWMIFMMIGSYLFLNLFVGVTIDKFQQMKASVGEGGQPTAIFCSAEQQEWSRVQRVMQKVKPRPVPRPEKGTAAAKLYIVVSHPWFDRGVMACIMLNTLSMASAHFGQSDQMTVALRGISMFFTVVFTAEAGIKLGTFGRSYFREIWNRFDFFIVVTSVVGELLAFIPSTSGEGGSTLQWLSRLVRVLRVGRLLRLINRIQTMRELFATLWLTLPALFNISMLLLLLFFIFAIVGMQLFAKVAYHDALDEHVNFRTFGVSMIALLRFSTGENWNGFMHSVAYQTEGCVVDPPYNKDMCGFADNGEDETIGCTPLNGCGTTLAFLYFLMFNTCISFVFLNLFIGVILEGFDNANEGSSPIKEGDFEAFQAHWSRYDPEADNYIQTAHLKEFLQTLFVPWGFGGARAEPSQVKRRIAALRLTVVYRECKDGNIHPVVHFAQVLENLAKFTLNHLDLDYHHSQKSKAGPSPSGERAASLLGDDANDAGDTVGGDDEDVGEDEETKESNEEVHDDPLHPLLASKSHFVEFVTTLSEFSLAAFDGDARRDFTVGIAGALEVAPAKVSVSNAVAGSVVVTSSVVALDAGEATTLAKKIGDPSLVLVDPKRFGPCLISQVRSGHRSEAHALLTTRLARPDDGISAHAEVRTAMRCCYHQMCEGYDHRLA